MKRLYTALALALAVLVLFAAHYGYTGKGWLLLSGKETIADFYYNRGLYYYGGGSYDINIARRNFEKSLAHSDGTQPFAHLELARTYFIVGDFSSALREVNAELELYPEHNRAHYVKGLIYGFRKQYVLAEEEFKTYIRNEEYPTWAPYNDLAWVYFAQGEYENASNTAWKGMQHTIQPPFSAWLENSYAVAQMNLRHYEVAEKYFLLAQTNFAAMTPAQWGVSYAGNNPADYEDGLEQARAAVLENLGIVHTKLNEK